MIDPLRICNHGVVIPDCAIQAILASLKDDPALKDRISVLAWEAHRQGALGGVPLLASDIELLAEISVTALVTEGAGSDG